MQNIIANKIIKAVWTATYRGYEPEIVYHIPYGACEGYSLALWCEETEYSVERRTQNGSKNCFKRISPTGLLILVFPNGYRFVPIGLDISPTYRPQSLAISPLFANSLLVGHYPCGYKFDETTGEHSLIVRPIPGKEERVEFKIVSWFNRDPRKGYETTVWGEAEEFKRESLLSGPGTVITLSSEAKLNARLIPEASRLAGRLSETDSVKLTVQHQV